MQYYTISITRKQDMHRLYLKQDILPILVNWNYLQFMCSKIQLHSAVVQKLSSLCLSTAKYLSYAARESCKAGDLTCKASGLRSNRDAFFWGGNSSPISSASLLRCCSSFLYGWDGMICGPRRFSLGVIISNLITKYYYYCCIWFMP